MQYVTAFPHTLGCGIILTSSVPISNELQQKLDACINTYEHTLSRFRNDSLIHVLAQEAHGTTVTFPQFCEPLFDLYDTFYIATHGAFDACVGADLVALGYDNTLAFNDTIDEETNSGKIGTLADWSSYQRQQMHNTWPSIQRNDTTVTTHSAVQLDFGAAGKGYLVDLLAQICAENLPEGTTFLINAGGDIRHCFTWNTKVDEHTPTIRVGLENPHNTNEAIGVATCGYGSFCASAPTRRHWHVPESELFAHHLINGLDGLPTHTISASWTYIPDDYSSSILYPTAYADAFATAFFLCDPAQLQPLAEQLHLSFAILKPDGSLQKSLQFPADFFTSANN